MATTAQHRPPPGPGEDPRPPWWHDPRVPVTAGAIIVLLLAFGAWQAIRAGIAVERRAMMEARAAEGFLLPASTTRRARVSLRAAEHVTLGGGPVPERLDLFIDARGDRFNTFRVAIVRDDGTAVLHVDRLQRDSNGDLHLALNSTLLPQGRYLIRVEGFTWRGETVAVGSLPMSVAAAR